MTIFLNIFLAGNCYLNKSILTSNTTASYDHFQIEIESKTNPQNLIETKSIELIKDENENDSSTTTENSFDEKSVNKKKI
jgi:hypothetical protein